MKEHLGWLTELYGRRVYHPPKAEEQE